MITIPTLLESFRTLKDKTFKIVFETNELDPEKISFLAQNLQSFGYLAFKKEDFTAFEVEYLNKLESNLEDGMKTQSQRIRAVLYRCWESEPRGYDVFEDYYRARTEKLISHLKKELEP